MGVGRCGSEWTGTRCTPTTNSLNDLRVGVVGPGRLGTALAAALREAGVAVDGPAGRGEIPAGCDAIVRSACPTARSRRRQPRSPERRRWSATPAAPRR